MPSKLARSDVERIAALARLALSDEDIELYSRQLTDILQYVEQIQQVDTTGVPATSQALGPEAAFRPDVPVLSLDRTAALANAPDANREAGLFRVPKVL